MQLHEQTLTSSVDGNHQQDRQLAVRELYLKPDNRISIIDAAQSDGRLYASDAEHIAEGVAKHLHLYDGPIADESFQQWATAIIVPAVERLGQFYELKAEHEKVIYKAIWSVLKTAQDLRDHDNPDVTVQQIADDVWLWVFLNLELLRTGTAKVSTRLYAKARWEARRWKQSRLRQRERFIDLDDPRQIYEDSEGKFHIGVLERESA